MLIPTGTEARLEYHLEGFTRLVRLRLLLFDRFQPFFGNLEGTVLPSLGWHNHRENNKSVILGGVGGIA